MIAKAFRTFIALGTLGMLAACGGGGAGGGGSAGGGGGAGGGGAAPATTATIVGTAAIGKALTGATIIVKDAEGRIVVTVPNAVANDGTFTISIANPGSFTPPFLLKADPTPSGPDGDEHYGILLNALDTSNPANNRANITPLTSLILFEATKSNLGEVFGNPAQYKNDLTQEVLSRARDNVIAELGGNSSTLANLSDKDLLGQPFVANNTGYDKALEELGIHSITFGDSGPILKKEDPVQTIAYDPHVPLYPVHTVTVAPQATSQTVGGTLNPITVTVLDSRVPAQPVKNVRVAFSTTSGTVVAQDGTPSNEAITDALGRAVLFLKSPDLVGLPARVLASSNGKEGEATVAYAPDVADADKTTLRATPGSVVYGRATTITAEVRDRFGNPVINQAVRLATNSSTGGFALGTGLTQETNVTTSAGNVAVTYTAGTTGSFDTITFTAANGASKTLEIPLVVDGVATVELVGVPSSVTVGATTQIQARARNNAGEVVIGADITFATTEGAFSNNAKSITVKTGSNGIASAALTAATSAVSAVVAASAVGGASSTATITYTVGQPETITLSATKTALETGDTSLITATVRDQYGNPVNAHAVTFSFAGTGSGTPGFSTLTATTNVNGQASVTYTAGDAAGTDALTARTANNKTAVNLSITVTVPPVQTITVAPGSASQVADGVTLNQIAATVKDARGNPAKGVTITFGTSAGTMANSAGNGLNTAVTDANGIARLWLKSATTVGIATVTARSDNFIQAQTTVTFTAGGPAQLGINLAPATLAPGGVTQVVVAVLDANGNPVADGHNVRLQTNSADGTFAGAAQTIVGTTQNGFVTVAYTAGSATGTETLTVKVNGAPDKQATLTVSAMSPAIASIGLAGPAGSVRADGATTATLTATVRDASNNPVQDVTVTFETEAGTLSANTATTNAQGIALVTLKHTVARNVTVRATASGFTANAQVQFTAGSAHTVGLNAMPNAVKPGGTSTLVASVLDANGNPVPNETVTFAIVTAGSGAPQLSFITRQTDANGLASAVYTAGANHGTDYVKATASTGASNPAPYQAITVSALTQVVGGMDALFVSREQIAINEKTVIRATVRDTDGAPVANIPVTFTTSAGAFNGSATATVNTDAHGVAQVELTAGSQVLVAQVSAFANGFSRQAQVQVTAGAASAVQLSAAPGTVKPGGSATLYAYVTDANGNPVVGESVSFALTAKGSGQPALDVVTQLTNQHGIAQITYSAGAAPGSDEIRAVIGSGGADTVTITVDASAIVIGQVTLTSGASSVQAGDTVTLRARVLDLDRKPVANRSVSFTATAGAVPAAASTNAEGYVEVTFTAPERIGSATVIANASGFLDSVTLDVVAGAPHAAKFNLIATPQSVGIGGGATITAVVLDAHDNPVPGVTVTFALTTNNSGATLTPLVADPTSVNGLATASYTAGPVTGTDTISGTLTTGASASRNIEVTGASLNRLSIGTDRVSVKSDGSDIATITVTALSAGNVVVPNITVHFSADGGQLSLPSVVTDDQGQAQVTFRADPQHRANANVTITASATGADERSIIVQIVGSTATLTVSASSVMVGGDDATVTVTARDASGNPIYAADVELTQEGAGPLEFAQASGKTDVNGRFTTTVSAPAASAPGAVTLHANVAGVDAVAALQVDGTFVIEKPAADPAELLVAGAPLEFEVLAPGVASVRFASSLGIWTSCNQGACVVPVAGGKATDFLSSPTLVGIADVEVEGLDATGKVIAKATRRVAVTGNTPSKVLLTASSSNLPPSLGSQKNSLSLVATLLDASDQAVNDAAVVFSIEKGTGSGEAIEPVLALTSQGQARATFTSGTLPTGQSQSAIRVRATAVGNPALFAEREITVGGSAGSVVIGHPTKALEVSDTLYRVRMTLMVADSNGNPMANQVVSLSTWPTRYAEGRWRPLNPAANTNCVPTGGHDPDPLTDQTDPALTVEGAAGDGVTNNDYQRVTWIANEDINENLILDPGEFDAKGDGLTPPNSAAGTLPSSVITDAHGVADFDLYYLKQYAAWVEVRIRASTLVQGSETRGEIKFALGYLRSEAQSCLLHDSPFND